MKKLLIFCITLVVLLTSTSTAYAQNWVDPSADDYAAALDKARGWDKPEADCNPQPISGDTSNPTTYEGSVNSEAIGKNMFENTLRATTVSIIGIGATRCTNTKLLAQLYKNSAIGTTTTLIASLYDNPPASGIYYAQNFLENLGVVKPAYAQGIGYSGLRPILGIWKVFRNLSYVILVVILVAIGFMVMFRMKLNAQTVVTIQAAIPNIVITLILITFSYAIAGLLIDLMYFLILIIISVFSQTGLLSKTPADLPTSVWGTPGSGDVTGWQQFFVNANIWDLMQSTMNWDTIMGFPASIAGGIINGMAQRAGENEGFGAILPWVGAVISGGLALLGSAVLVLLVAIALLLTFIRLFMIFLNSYIQIIVSIIIAPLQLLVGAIPGRNTFRNWLMGIIGNLIVFPAAIAIFFLNWSIMDAAYNQAGGTTLWSPPFLFANPYGAAVGASPIMGLVGFGILMLTPTLLNTIKGLFAPKPFLPISPAMVISPLMGGLQSAMGIAQQRYYLGQSLSGIPVLGTGPIGKIFGVQQKTPSHGGK